MKKKGKVQKDLEWENRTLCSDGNCIGIIGNDGRCKECGKRYEGDLPWLRATDSSSEKGQNQGLKNVGENFTDNKKNRSDNVSQAKTDTDLEWENRTLCSDGNCIGIIGPDGRCKECGKPLEK